MSDESKKNGEPAADSSSQVKTLEPATPAQEPADIMQKNVKTKEGMPSLVTKFQYGAGFDTTKLGPRVVDLLMSATDEAGFLNGEVMPSEHVDVREWLLIQRFRTPEQTEAWRVAPKRQDAVK